MSKEIPVTVITETEEQILYHGQGERLLDTLISRGGYVPAACGGRGTCGQCAVQFITNPTLPSHGDRAAFSPEKLRAGYRLACLSKPMSACKIRLCFPSRKPMEIVTTYTDEAADKGSGCGKGSNASDIVSDKRNIEDGGITEDGRYVIAVDIGTTTVAMQLIHTGSGSVAATHAFVNPQRSFGADVISRIQAAGSGKREKLQEVICKSLEHGINMLVRQAAVHTEEAAEQGENNTESAEAQTLRPEIIIISCNTTMAHLLLGADTTSLGVHPFAPAFSGWTETTLCGIRTILIPGVSAFVGGDIVSGIYACGMQENKDVTLFIDLGTNGEMAIGNRDRLLCTATAAGPAFDGGPTAGVYGADMISIAAGLLRSGIMDETGLLADPYFESGYHIDTTPQAGNYIKGTENGKAPEIIISQQDIRALQMAKAAVCAGIRILVKRYGITFDQVSQLYLAGGFGLKLNVADAKRIGLFPKELGDNITAVMNTSLKGACLFGMAQNTVEGSKAQNSAMADAWQHNTAAKAIDHIMETAEEINLAKQPEFEAMYLEELNFPAE